MGRGRLERLVRRRYSAFTTRVVLVLYTVHGGRLQWQCVRRHELPWRVTLLRP